MSDEKQPLELTLLEILLSYKRERDELLSAAKRALTYFKGTPNVPEGEPNPIEIQLEQAIAKAEGDRDE